MTTGLALRTAGQADVLAAEQWKAIPGWEGHYEVSDRGRVRSLDYWQPGGNGARRLVPGAIKSTWVTNGYTYISLKRGGKRQSIGVHVLVLSAFHGERTDEAPVTRHLDGDRSNNRPDNLAWGTYADNSWDTVRHGRNRNKNKTHCPHGHAYTPENTHFRPSGHRTCRACKRQRDARRVRRVA